MSYYIIIRGPLGAGKSTIAQTIAQKLGAKVFHIDNIIDELGLDKVPPDAPCIPAESFIKANESVLQSAKELLKKGTVVIFDGNFYHKEALDHLINNLPFKGVVFTLKAPLELCVERDEKRGLSYGEGAAEAVFSLVSRFDYGIAVDVSGSLDETIKKIFEQLPKF